MLAVQQYQAQDYRGARQLVVSFQSVGLEVAALPRRDRHGPQAAKTTQLFPYIATHGDCKLTDVVIFFSIAAGEFLDYYRQVRVKQHLPVSRQLGSEFVSDVSQCTPLP